LTITDHVVESCNSLLRFYYTWNSAEGSHREVSPAVHLLTGRRSQQCVVLSVQCLSVALGTPTVTMPGTAWCRLPAALYSDAGQVKGAAWSGRLAAELCNLVLIDRRPPTGQNGWRSVTAAAAMIT